MLFRCYFLDRNSPKLLRQKIRKFPQLISHEVSNSMVVFSRIHSRVSSLLTFLLRRHADSYPSRRFLANNSIYKKATSFISFRAKRSRLSGYVYHIFCFLVILEESFKGLKLGLKHAFCLMSPIFVFLFNYLYNQ